METIIMNIVGLEKRRDELAEQFTSAEIDLRSELIDVERQEAEGMSVPSVVALVQAGMTFLKST